MRSLDPFTPSAPFQRSLVAAVFLTIAPVALSAQTDSHAIAAVSVSPGGLEGDPTTAPRCPTFSWGLLLADEIEFAVYDATAAGEIDPRVHRLHELLPGSVTSWTPPAESCFEPGATYAWSVRGLIGGEAAGGWSEPRTFEVAAAPTDEEIRQAIETLARARDSNAPSPLPLESSPKTLGRSLKNVQLAPSSAGGVSSLTPPVQKEFSVESSMGTSTALYAKNLTGQAGYFDGDIAIHGLIEAAGSMAIGYAPSGFNPAPVVDAEVLGTNQFASAVRGTGSGGSEGHLGRGNFGVFGGAADGGGIGVQGIATSADSVGVIGVNTQGGFAGEFLGAVDIDGHLHVRQPLDESDAVFASGLNGGAGRLGVGFSGVVGQSTVMNSTVSAAVVGLNPNGGPAGLFEGELILKGDLDCSSGDPCVGSTEIKTGAVRPQHLERLLEGSVYQVEVREDSLDTHTTAEAYCRDSNDFPLQGYCDDDGGIDNFPLKAFEPIDWDVAGRPAGWLCRIRNSGGSSNSYIRAGIVCLDVP